MIRTSPVIFTWTATGAAVNFSLGFIPDKVEILNYTSNDELKWHRGYTAAYGSKRVAAGTGSTITSGGISTYSGAESADGTGTYYDPQRGAVVASGKITAPGFTLSTDTDINVNTEVLYITAYPPAT